MEEFYDLVRMLDDIEKGIVDRRFCASSSFFVLDAQDKLIGAARLAHYLTVEGLGTWGHIGYGVRPRERRKGYATEILSLLLQEGKTHYHIHDFLIGAYEDNIGSIKTIEKCGGVLENQVIDAENAKRINRYWVHVR